ncbi:PAS domain-containing protein [Salarchaeum japonicum]|uniref:HTR-like protein n=1 Tax=Salarchaeum japonicum TaxID=555573 RepID=A0AAV3T365_9EURY|nr:PAS domain-containing protein [Salarchaeum japonicum]
MASSPLNDIVSFSPDNRTIRVLLVDDDEATVELSTRFLERELDDVTITGVSDPSEVRDHIQEREYDCIVSDYDMPESNGLDLLHSLRADDCQVPFVLFTGKGNEEIASRAISAGVDEYLQKDGADVYPVLANKIETLVEKHWAESQVRQGFLAIESAQEGIGIIDADGTYRYLNPAYAEVYERTREELVGTHWSALYSREERARFETDILPELEATGSWRGRATGVTKSGRTVPERLVLTQLADGGHVCVVEDLTEEEDLLEDLAIRDRALDATSVGVVITDPTREDNPIVYVNEGFTEMTGYGREEAMGRNCRFLQGPETDPSTVRELREAVENEETVMTEILNYTKSGEPFWNLVEVSPVRDDAGETVNFVGFQRQITKRKERTIAIEEQLEWLHDFGQVLSHDLKTPLTVLKGNIELARDGDESRLDDARRAADRLSALISDLSNVMRQGDLVTDVEPVDIANVFRSWDAFETEPASLTVVESKRVLADERALVRLADNLVKNTVEHADADTAMRVGALPGGFYYEDDGPGIPVEERERVFKPGYTTKEDGTGFGMVSIKQIALAHGWTVSIGESDSGGARFEFTGVESPED